MIPGIQVLNVTERASGDFTDRWHENGPHGSMYSVESVRVDPSDDQAVHEGTRFFVRFATLRCDGESDTPADAAEIVLSFDESEWAAFCAFVNSRIVFINRDIATS